MLIIAEVGIAAFYVALLCTPGPQITPFCAMPFCYLYDLPQELRSCLDQSAYGELVSLCVVSLQFQEPIDNLK